MTPPYHYKREMLRDEFFEKVTKQDFPRLRDKRNEYHAFSSWEFKPDGHGGDENRESLEDFRKLPNYRKLKDEMDLIFGELI